MFKEEKSLKEAELKNVNGGFEAGFVKGEHSVSLVNTGSKTTWSCPHCGSTDFTETEFDEGGSKIECSNCHYTVYM